MGLSSSQARLLSITARLTDNEYKSQRITNAKMHLSNLGIEAQQDYAETLNAQKLEYTNYNSASKLTREDLTPAIIYEYQPYKNQYSLVNTAGQVLVSRLDAQNYKETSNLKEFLERYDLIEEKVITTIVKEPYETTVINPDYEQYLIDLADWEAREPEHYLTTTTPAWTERIHEDPYGIYSLALNTKDMDLALQGDTNAFMNVIASWIGAGYHQTSSGESFYITVNTDETSDDYWSWNTAHQDVSETLVENIKFSTPCHESGVNETVDIQYNGDIYQNIGTKDWACDAPYEGLPGPNHVGCDDTSHEYSLHQKLVDFLWYLQEKNVYSNGTPKGGSLTNEVYLKEFFHILEFDFDEVTSTVEHPEETLTTENPEYVKWLSEKPEEVPEYITSVEYEDVEVNKVIIEVNDKDKAQWYTNLWYRMNGYNDPAKIETRELTNDLDEVTYYHSMNFYDREKETFAKNYAILDSKLVTSKDWLYDALKEGIITMECINSNNSSEFKKLNWQSIIYTNATDIVETDDKEKVARAEVKYEEAMETINTKDKQFQMELKRLDTEHNALLTEYDSVKAAMEANTERSFKAFQG